MEYLKERPWVEQALTLLDLDREEEEEEFDDEEEENQLYRWTILGPVKKVETKTSTVKIGKDRKWLLNVNERMTNPPKFRSLIELKQSTAKVEGKEGFMGMFAAIRFERGDIITVQRKNERPLFRNYFSSDT